MTACHCGHEGRDHGLGEDPSCCVLVACPCWGFDDGFLPAPGERPVFGVHHLPSVEAAWVTESEATRERRFRDWVRGALDDPE